MISPAFNSVAHAYNFSTIDSQDIVDSQQGQVWQHHLLFCRHHAIVDIQPFAWDSSFAALDRLIHGGVAPWRLTWALFGSPWATNAIDFIYASWFAVIYSMPLAVLMFDNNRQRRSQIVLTHMLLWVIAGSGMALLLSSAGPCFYEGVYGTPGDFGPLMQNLAAVDRTEPLIALELQRLLWESYQELRSQIEGISAMPSLHIAQAVLVALAAQRYSPKLAVMAWVYAALIFVGSVHLGWHYAVDGYVALVLTVALWWAVGKVHPRPTTVERGRDQTLSGRD